MRIVLDTNVLVISLPKTSPYRLIFDDNKFVDCAIAGNAKYIVTEDKHFNALKEIEFPKVEVINADMFLEVLKRG